MKGQGRREMGKFFKATNDAVFKAMFCNNKNKDLLQKLIETSLQEKVEVLEILPPEIIKKNIYVKNKTLDSIVKLKGKIICIEMNSGYYEGLNRRNFAYIASKYVEETKIGDNYNNMREFIQINFTKGLPKNYPGISKYIFIDKKSGIDYIDNFIIYEFNLDKVSKNCYNEYKEYKFIALLDANKEEIHKLSKGDRIMEKFEKEINKLNEDVEFTNYISAEEDAIKVHNTLISNARKEGESIGLAKEKQNIAKKLIEMKMPIENIVSATGLSQEEIENLK